MELTGALAYTVVVLADDADGKQILDLAAQWRRCGMIRPVAFVQPADVDRTSTPAVVLGRDPDEEQPFDLFARLATQPLQRVRLILLQTQPPGQPDDLGEVADLLGDLLRASLPRAHPGDAASGCELLQINLMVPTSGDTGWPRTALHPRWEVNAVVAPDDRPAPDRANVFVRRPGNYHRHALTAAVSAGGLWPGLAVGALDDRSVESPTGEFEALVVRCTVRALVGHDLDVRLTQEAMSRILEDELGAAGQVSWARPVAEPEVAVERVLAALLAHGDWAGRSEPGQAPRPRQYAVGQAARDVVRFHRQLIGLMGGWLLGVAGRSVERVATGLTVGDEADYVVRLRPEPPAVMGQRAAERVAVRVEQIRTDAVHREAASVPACDPQTWVRLRALAAGLVDGSPLPPPFAALTEGGVPTLLSPTQVVPPPDDVLRGHDGTVVRPLDAAAARATAATVTGTGDNSGDTDQSRDAWWARREACLLWRLADDVGRRRDAARRQAAASKARAVEEYTPDLSLITAAQRTLRATWAIALLLLAGTLGYQAWMLLDGGRPWSVAAANIALAVVAALVLVTIGNHRYYRASRRFEWRVLQELHAREAAATDWVQSHRESRRLARLYDQLLDWGEIIGWTLHQPWRPGTLHRDAATTPTIDMLPAAVAVARPVGGPALSREQVCEAVDVVCPQGFATRFLDERVAADAAGPGVGTGHLPIDVDGTSDRARRDLLTRLRTGELGAHAAHAEQQRVRAALESGRLRLPAQQVQPVDGSTASTEEEFFHPIGMPAVPFADETWSPSGLQRQRHLVERSVRWVPVAAGDNPADPGVETHRTPGWTALRVDTSRTCVPDDLAMFTPATPEPELVDLTVPRQSSLTPQEWN